MKKIVVNGKAYEVYTIGEFSKKAGKSTMTLRKYEEHGTFPAANIRIKDTRSKIDGTRFYTKQLVEKVSDVLKDVRQGVPFTDAQKAQIALYFREEKEMLMKGA